MNYKEKTNNTNLQKVSVIIPTYNRGWILNTAIDSVLEQNYKNVELIIVDDGSKDNTFKILEKYGPKINLISQKNSGVSAARNAGIKIATGKFITFLDSDDHWLQGKLTAQINFFNLNPDAKICQTEEVWIRNGKKVNPGNRHKKLSGMIFEKSLELCLVSPSAVMLKKTLLNEVGLFDETLPACEDYDLWLRISWKYPVFLINDFLTVKTGGHPDQLSKMVSLDKFRIRSIDRMIKSGNLSVKQRSTAIKILKKKCAIYTSGCLKRGKNQEAKKYINLAKTSF